MDDHLYVIPFDNDTGYVSDVESHQALGAVPNARYETYPVQTAKEASYIEKSSHEEDKESEAANSKVSMSTSDGHESETSDLVKKIKVSNETATMGRYLTRPAES